MNITKKHIERIQGIDTPRKAFTALRAMGYRKCDLQMTRMATTYAYEGKMDGRLQISIPRHGEAFIILDRKKRDRTLADDGGWAFISSALSIGNLADGASSALQVKLERMMVLGVIQEGDNMSMMQLAVAFVTACHLEEQKEAN